MKRQVEIGWYCVLKKRISKKKKKKREVQNRPVYIEAIYVKCECNKMGDSLLRETLYFISH